MYPEQVKGWREACEQATDWQQAQARQSTRAKAEEKKRIRELERELLLARQDGAQFYDWLGNRFGMWLPASWHFLLGALLAFVGWKQIKKRHEQPEWILLEDSMRNPIRE